MNKQIKIENEILRYDKLYLFNYSGNDEDWRR